MIRHFFLAIALGLWPALASAAEPPAPLKVLFLGDKGHHLPADRAAQIKPIMASRGINITYTEDMASINPENLAKYDALLLYANIDNIDPRQAKALLDYVAGGGGFVPLHCASYCFRNSPDCVALIGAQFLRHGTGEFDTKVVDANHAITKGLEPFRTWDETYVHHLHNEKDRHVLQVRAEGNKDEPWTWVRTHGKGRVFYTAYGHDARTWEKPGFHDLVERGIRWAAAKGEVFDSRPRVAAGLKPFDYAAAPSAIPLYLPGRSWGTQGEPIKQMQQPAAPAESLKHMAVPDGFEVRLFAAEPEINKPITMAWDHRGRLWIVESTDYPNGKRPGNTGNDRIKICEDTDGDGRADKFTVFAEGLNIPTSLTFANGGIIVHQAPETLFFKDTNGDDRSDVRKVLFTGWDTGDTHAGPSNLRWGIDNWIYGIDGYSGFRGRVGDEQVSFRQGLYRLKADGSKLEFLRNTNNNSWGVGVSEEGLLFGSTANGCPSVFLPIPNRYYEGVRGWSGRVLPRISATNNFYPATDKVRQVDFHGGFTAAAGHALYTARAYPPYYWNSTAFVTEPTGHLVATFTLDRKGTDYVSYNAWNLVASNDEWSSPILAEVGPDGHVWIIDWYNYIVQHNPTPQGFKTGRGNAYETPLRDKTHGRIYRIVFKGAKPSESPKLDSNDPKGLVKALQNDNMFWRLHAQRLLVERGQRDVVPELLALAADRATDAIGLNVGAIHALWTLQGLAAIDEAKAADVAVAALKHPSAGVRRNALQVLPRVEGSTAAVLEAGVLKDPDAQVRLAALLALADLPPTKPAADAIVALLVEGRADRDRWMGDAATAAAAKNDGAFLTALATQRFDGVPRDPTTSVAARVAEHFARGAPAEAVGPLVKALEGADRRVTEAVVAGLAKGWPKGSKATLDPAAEKAMTALLPRLSTEARGRMISLAERWGSNAFAKYSAEISATLLASARDESKSDTSRADAARQVVEFRPRDAKAVNELLDLLTPRTAPTLANGLVDAVGRSETDEAGQLLVERLPAMTPQVRSTAVRVLLSRGGWTKTLLDGVENGTVRFTELSLDQRQALAAHPDKTLATRAKQLLGRGGGLPDPDRQKVIETLSPLVLKGGDPAKGKAVFVQQCAKCHTHSGEGGKVGPDLTGVAVHPREELLVHVIDPSRSVEGNFVQYNLATKDGRTITGLLAAETRTSVDLIDVEAKTHTVLREDIDELAASKKSIMPEGFEKQVPTESITDLLAFLTQRGKYVPIDIRKVANVVSTRGMFYDSDSEVERLIFPDWTPKTFEGVPFLLLDPQGSRTPNMIMLHGPLGAIPPKMPRSVTLPCRSPAKAIHLLSGISGWGYQGGDPQKTVSMIVRLHYADGKTEDHALQNGVHFADYIRRIDVPSSKLAFMLRGRQVRYLSIKPKRPETIENIELIKGPDETAPVVVAATIETP